MSVMDTLVWDRVPGAAYGWQDMNRVAEAMEYVAERLHGYGFNLTVEPQRFTREDFPTPAARPRKSSRTSSTTNPSRRSSIS